MSIPTVEDREKTSLIYGYTSTPTQPRLGGMNEKRTATVIPIPGQNGSSKRSSASGPFSGSSWTSNGLKSRTKPSSSANVRSVGKPTDFFDLSTIRPPSKRPRQSHEETVRKYLLPPQAASSTYVHNVSSDNDDPIETLHDPKPTRSLEPKPFPMDGPPEYREDEIDNIVAGRSGGSSTSGAKRKRDRSTSPPSESWDMIQAKRPSREDSPDPLAMASTTVPKAKETHAAPNCSTTDAKGKGKEDTLPKHTKTYRRARNLTAPQSITNMDDDGDEIEEYTPEPSTSTSTSTSKPKPTPPAAEKNPKPLTRAVVPEGIVENRRIQYESVSTFQSKHFSAPKTQRKDGMKPKFSARKGVPPETFYGTSEKTDRPAANLGRLSNITSSGFMPEKNSLPLFECHNGTLLMKEHDVNAEPMYWVRWTYESIEIISRDSIAKPGTFTPVLNLPFVTDICQIEMVDSKQLNTSTELDSSNVLLIAIALYPVPRLRRPHFDPVKDKIVLVFDQKHMGWAFDKYSDLLGKIRSLRRLPKKPRISTISSGASFLEIHKAQLALRVDKQASSDSEDDKAEMQVDLGEAEGSSGDGLPSSTSRSTRQTRSSKPATTETKTALTTKPEPHLRRSSRVVPRAVNEHEVILIYPPVEITNGDLDRLEPNEFMNDTLIEFGLKYWMNSVKEENPALWEQIWVFNSFFYKKLSVKNFEEGYRSVKKWTSKAKIFEKEYIIIPINEHLHWYLAIIYQPQYTLTPPPASTIKSPRTPSTRSRMAEQAKTALEPHLVSDEDILMGEAVSGPADDDADSAEVDAELRQSAATSETQSEYAGYLAEDLATDHRSPQPSLSDHEEEFGDLTVDPNSTLDENPDWEDGALTGTTALQREIAADVDVDVDIDMDSLQMDDNNFDIGHLRYPDEEMNDATIEPRTKPVQTEVPLHRPNGVAQPEAKKPAIANRINLSPAPSEDAKDVDMEDSGPDFEMIEASPDKNTYIFILDSLGGKHPAAIRTLKNWLKAEAKDKLGQLQTSEARGVNAVVPYQPNHTDCGVYLLHFAEMFMSNPVSFKNRLVSLTKRKGKDKPATRDVVWDVPRVRKKRADLKDLVLSLSQDWKESRKLASTAATEGSSANSPKPILPDTTTKANHSQLPSTVGPDTKKPLSVLERGGRLPPVVQVTSKTSSKAESGDARRSSKAEGSRQDSLSNAEKSKLQDKHNPNDVTLAEAEVVPDSDDDEIIILEVIGPKATATQTKDKTKKQKDNTANRIR